MILTKNAELKAKKIHKNVNYWGQSDMIVQIVGCLSCKRLMWALFPAIHVLPEPSGLIPEEALRIAGCGPKTKEQKHSYKLLNELIS